MSSDGKSLRAADDAQGILKQLASNGA